MFMRRIVDTEEVGWWRKMKWKQETRHAASDKMWAQGEFYRGPSCGFSLPQRHLTTSFVNGFIPFFLLLLLLLLFPIPLAFSHKSPSSDWAKISQRLITNARRSYRNNTRRLWLNSNEGWIPMQISLGRFIRSAPIEGAPAHRSE